MITQQMLKSMIGITILTGIAMGTVTSVLAETRFRKTILGETKSMSG
jgi:hypothetical protein